MIPSIPALKLTPNKRRLTAETKAMMREAYWDYYMFDLLAIVLVDQPMMMALGNTYNMTIAQTRQALKSGQWWYGGNIVFVLEFGPAHHVHLYNHAADWPQAKEPAPCYQ